MCLTFSQMSLENTEYTKKDKLKKTAQKQSLERINEMLSGYEGIELFPFSALNGEGTDEIREVITQYVENF